MPFLFIRRSFPVHFLFKCCSKGPLMAVFIGYDGAFNLRNMLAIYKTTATRQLKRRLPDSDLSFIGQ